MISPKGRALLFSTLLVHAIRPSTSFSPNNKITPAIQPGKLVKPRPQSIFLLEKTLGTIENAATSLLPVHDQDRGPGKERLVILGSGWGAVSILKEKRLTKKYDVTVISPKNSFVFTPLLAGASVGSVEVRTISEPIREVSFDRSKFHCLMTDGPNTLLCTSVK